MKKNIPEYYTHPDTRCPECGELCEIVPLRNEFDYAGSHASHGLPGCHYPSNWGQPVTSCCLFPLEEYDGDDYE